MIPFIENWNKIDINNNRTKRNINAGIIDNKHLQTAINDNRMMIQYLFVQQLSQ